MMISMMAMVKISMMSMVMISMMAMVNIRKDMGVLAAMGVARSP